MLDKYKWTMPNLEEQIMGLYMRGMTTRNISSLLDEQYRIELDKDSISNITDKLLLVIKEWKCRPLSEYYPMIFIDGFRTGVKKNGTFADKSVYIIMGINEEVYKEVLNFTISESESAQYLLTTLNV